MASLCKWVVRVFALLYAFALFIFLTGTFGWFGQEQDPLSAVYLLPLGLPWNLWLDGLPETVTPWAAAAAPMMNILVLSLLCRFARRA